MKTNNATDRRVVLSPEDKQAILHRWENPLDDVSQRQLARDFNCSRRTIQFIIDPKQLADNMAARRQRIALHGSYYDKDKHRVYTQRHRAHKRNLKEESQDV